MLAFLIVLYLTQLVCRLSIREVDLGDWVTYRVTIREMRRRRWLAELTRRSRPTRALWSPLRCWRDVALSWHGPSRRSCIWWRRCRMIMSIASSELALIRRMSAFWRSTVPEEASRYRLICLWSFAAWLLHALQNENNQPTVVVSLRRQQITEISLRIDVAKCSDLICFADNFKWRRRRRREWRRRRRRTQQATNDTRV